MCSEGQSQLQNALAAQSLPPVQVVALTHTAQISQDEAPVNIPLQGTAHAQIAQKSQNKISKKSSRPASTPQEIEIELLKRQLIAANTKITSTENALSESRDSYSILAKRMNIFEQRENEANFSRMSGFHTSGVPPDASTDTPGQSYPANATLTCAAPLLLAEVSTMKCMLEDLQSSVSILLRAASHPLPLHLSAVSPPMFAPNIQTVAPRDDFSVPPPPFGASHPQFLPSILPQPHPMTLPSVPMPSSATCGASPMPEATVLPSSTPPLNLQSSQSQEAAGQLLPPLIPTFTPIEPTQAGQIIEDSCLLYSPASTNCHVAQSSIPQSNNASSTPTPPPSRPPAPRPRQATRPPTWAEITARRIPPLFNIPIWQPGCTPLASTSQPQPRAFTVWRPGSAPNSCASAPHPKNPRPRPAPSDQRQTHSNSSRPRTKGTSGQGRSRQVRQSSTQSQPIQELLIDLN